MKVIRTKNYQEMSKMAAEFILNKINSSSKLTLGLATGGTPVQTYHYLAQDYREHQTSYQHVTTFNLDEYIGLAKSDPNSYHYYMDKHFFSKVNIPTNQTFIPNGLAENLEMECYEYDELIKKHHGIDLQILGLGKNGHVGFNEPGTAFDQHTHIVELTNSTIQANARFFNDINQVPKRAITMGIGSIMESKEILLLVSGTEKNEALNKLLHGEIDEQFPASILNQHENVTIIADEDAIINTNL
ncbi:glucosamine-6-phosphate deaminase [Gracilibacillus sp. D59]|uniref:glucosamine-6-phosphate deaminase n=1 Tax=Gracilibacillus sp. D59 TaxID=3457434 RepID=UPI003FCCDE17